MSRGKEAESPRSANKKARSSRRQEIQRRWNRRWAERSFEEDFFAAAARTGSVDDLTLLELVLHYSRWMPHAYVLAMAQLTTGEVLSFAVSLVRLIELKEMDYDEYLLTPEWQASAVRAKKRYDGKCALDARHPAEDAHHRTYARRGRERDNDLIPLCRECHTLFHRR